MFYNSKLKLLRRFNFINLYGFTNKLNFFFTFNRSIDKVDLFNKPLIVKILKHIYNVNLKKLKTYFNKFLFVNCYTFLTLLQKRLDFVLYTLNLCVTVNQAKQHIAHKHILVNNKIVQKSSYSVKQNDIIHVRNICDKSLKHTIIYNYIIKNLKSNMFKHTIYKIKTKNQKFLTNLRVKFNDQFVTNTICITTFKLKINTPINDTLSIKLQP